MTTQENMQHKRSALLNMVITALLWSLGGFLIKMVDSNPIAIAGSRSAIAAIVLWIYLKKPKFNWSKPQIFAALAYTGTVILFVTANKMTTASNAVLLQYTAPIYVALLGAWLLKERVKLADWITIFITIGGMVLFFFDDIDTRGFLGNMFALLSGVCFALFAVFMRMQKDGSPLESVLLGNILTALIGLPFLIGDTPDATGWLCLLVLGVMQLGIPYILYAKAVKHLSALEVILIPVLEPLLNPVWVLLLVGEAPGSMALVGGAIVMIAVTVRCILPVLVKPALPEKNRRAS